MSVAQFIGGAFFIAGSVLLVGSWIVALLQWIFCRKKKTCSKTKCICRQFCINDSVQREEDLRLRRMMLEQKLKDIKREQ